MLSVPTHLAPGRSLVTRRAILDIVRAAALGSYGVTGFAGSPWARLLARVRVAQPGIRLDLRHGLSLELGLTVAYGLPIAEVARQVDSAVRHAIRRALGREVERLTIQIRGLRLEPGSGPRERATRAGPRSTDLAESGMDVA